MCVWFGAGFNPNDGYGQAWLRSLICLQAIFQSLVSIATVVFEKTLGKQRLCAKKIKVRNEYEKDDDYDVLFIALE